MVRGSSHPCRGLAHYKNPTEGVHAPDMMRHCLGEDLKVGATSRGARFDTRSSSSRARRHGLTPPYILRYDIEVCGFGSHRSGHLVLLRLKDQMYPGGRPATLADAGAQYAPLGQAAGRGERPGPQRVGPGCADRGAAQLPGAAVDGIGANEYVVDVTHDVPGPDGKPVPAVDFISTVDTPYVWELNMWYHTLNCGFRTRASGETDFPCIYGERVGLGRSYVKLDGKLDYAAWCEGIRRGRSYVGDGRSHLMEFKVNDARIGENGSELRLSAAGRVKANVGGRSAARAAQSRTRGAPLLDQPSWSIERARMGDTRDVASKLSSTAIGSRKIPCRRRTAGSEIRGVNRPQPLAGAAHPPVGPYESRSWS